MSFVFLLSLVVFVIQYGSRNPGSFNAVKPSRLTVRRKILTLAQPFFRRVKKHLVRVAEDLRNLFGKRTLGDGFAQFCFAEIGGGFSGKPVVALAEKVITHFSPRDQVERFRVSPE